MDKAYKTLASIDYADFISNKVNFHKNYSKFTKREFLSSDATFEEFELFLNRHPEFVQKPLRGLGGGDVKKVAASSIKDKNEFFKKLKNEDFFIEELIVQDPEWGKLGPDSINTLRIMTETANNESKIIFAAARIGSGKSIADNFHQGGMAVLIDRDKGVLTGNGFDKKLNESPKSISGVTFDGTKVPYWHEIEAMVLEAANVNPNIHMVGWDVAITPDGPLIVEGNRGPGFDLVQILLKKGAKYMLDDVLVHVRQTA